jgi:hypothetical protein
MFYSFWREREIRSALRAIARQRVAMVLEPGCIPVVERSPPREEWFECAARTCVLRGWAEVLQARVPVGVVASSGGQPQLPDSFAEADIYKLTEGGWAVLHRSHGWVVATFLVSSVALAATVAALVVAWLSMPPVGAAERPIEKRAIAATDTVKIGVLPKGAAFLRAVTQVKSFGRQLTETPEEALIKPARCLAARLRAQ